MTTEYSSGLTNHWPGNTTELVITPEERREGVPKKLGVQATYPTDEEIDQMTPEQIRQWTQRWAMDVGTTYN